MMPVINGVIPTRCAITCSQQQLLSLPAVGPAVGLARNTEPLVRQHSSMDAARGTAGTLKVRLQILICIRGLLLLWRLRLLWRSR